VRENFERTKQAGPREQNDINIDLHICNFKTRGERRATITGQ